MTQYSFYMILAFLLIGCSDKSIKEYENDKTISKANTFSSQANTQSIKKAILKGYVIDREFLNEAGLYMYTMQVIGKDPVLFFNKDKILFNKKDLVEVKIENNYMISFVIAEKEIKNKIEPVEYIQESKILQKRTLDRKNHNIPPPIEEKINLF